MDDVTVNEPQFDPKRFEALLTYAAWRLRDRLFGATLANKVAWFADFESVRRRGVPLTGATYIHKPQGPVARQMPAALERLRDARALREEVTLVHDYAARRYSAARDPGLPGFTAEEKQIVDHAIAVISPLSARAASEWSHRFDGWRATDDDDVIPYETAFGQSIEPSPDDLHWAETVAVPTREELSRWRAQQRGDSAP